MTPHRSSAPVYLLNHSAAPSPFFVFFFFNDTATTEIYTLSLHDALPIWPAWTGTSTHRRRAGTRRPRRTRRDSAWVQSDRKSTRLNSSHLVISYAVFCLKKKKKQIAGTQSNYHGAGT